MLVGEVMTKDVITVSPTDRVRDAAKKIVDHKVSGVFVTDAGKLIGKISHRDLLRMIFPSQVEFYDDLVHNLDFDQIETRTGELIDQQVIEVMDDQIMKVRSDEHIMKVAAWMLIRKVHRAAVIDEYDNLLGVISRGDIFYSALQRETAKSKPAKTRARVRVR
jgi:CBS domain-containing protein